MTKVLILLSTYNGEKYLKELIDSILEQKNIDVSLLIRDDGSTDSTKKIVEEYSKKNKNISYKFEKNVGPTNSFFDLIKIASESFDYYALSDQDDIWLDNKLSAAVSLLSDCSCDIPALYYSGQILTDESLNVIDNHFLDSSRSLQANFIFNQMAGCTAVLNKKMLLLLKHYIPEKISSHDAWCYRLCAALNGKIIVDKNGYILYRQHGNNVVGINGGIKGKIERAHKYIFKYNVSDYAREILSQYKTLINDEWDEYLHDIVNSNKSMRTRIKMLKNRKIKFNNIYLRYIFIVKVLLKKM